MVFAVESQSDEAITNHSQDDVNRSNMMGRFRQNGFASQQRFGNSPGNFQSPSVMLIRAIRESNDETGVGDAIHPLEKPLREERFLGPLITPAQRMNGLSFLASLAFSN